MISGRNFPLLSFPCIDNEDVCKKNIETIGTVNDSENRINPSCGEIFFKKRKFANSNSKYVNRNNEDHLLSNKSISDQTSRQNQNHGLSINLVNDRTHVKKSSSPQAVRFCDLKKEAKFNSHNHHHLTYNDDNKGNNHSFKSHRSGIEKKEKSARNITRQEYQRNKHHTISEHHKNENFSRKSNLKPVTNQKKPTLKVKDVSFPRQNNEEEDKIIDRIWFDRDENSDIAMDIYADYCETKISQDKEDKLKKLQKGRKLNLKENLRRQENELWEIDRMKRSGIYVRQEVNLNFDDDDNTSPKDIVIVRNQMKPPFLDSQLIFTRQLELISPVKDPTSDLAILSRKGSDVIRKLREEESRKTIREKFFDVSTSRIGGAIGLHNPNEALLRSELLKKNSDESYNYKLGLQYGEILKKQGNSCTDSLKLKSIEDQRQGLPIYGCKDELMKLIRQFQVVIIVGETGSGKTTQLTQYLLEEKCTNFGIIGCTQPRRVAAVSVAKRVADEMGVILGDEVGYSIRFEDCTSEKTKIKYMTDGVLTRESLHEHDLDKYSVIVMDEAHERSLCTDVLFGLLKNIISRRFDLKLIVTSATMDSEKFSSFFGGCPIFNIPGRTFPVSIEFVRSPCDDYVDQAVQKALQIHCSADSIGDILIFMTGKEDIDGCCTLLSERLLQLGDKVSSLCILPIYSQLASDLQAKIFEPSEFRKVVVATNIAETSLTIDGIKYVIDTGYCKLKVFNPKIGMDTLQVTPISQSNANQRSGRAGRTGPGICYRLYTERAFITEMYQNAIPEIQRTNLANVILLLKSLGVKDLLDFDFMDAPPQDAMVSALFQLWNLGALDNFGDITPLGQKMAQFPLDPPLGKMLVNSVNFKASSEVLSIVSMLSVPNFFVSGGKEKIEEIESAREKFFVPESDQLTLLNIYTQWKSNGYRDSWCNQHFLYSKSMKKSREIRSQLLDIMTQQKMECLSCENDWDIIREVICSGYFSNAAKLKGIGEYVNLRTSLCCHLHPNSAIYGAGSTPEYVVYHEVILTTKEYMRNVTVVEPKWLAKYAPMFFTLRQVNTNSNDFMVNNKEQIQSDNLNKDYAAAQIEFDKKILEDAKIYEKQKLKGENIVTRKCKVAEIGSKSRVALMRRKNNKFC